MSVVYAGVSALLVVTVVAMAYGMSAPAFGVAEFSPSARQQLDATPSTSDTASAEGKRGSRRATTTTASPASTTMIDATEAMSAPPTTKVARARDCFEHSGGVMLQTADPMSPACLATVFEGDNGGATAAGVTPTEIRVAIPTPTGFTTDSAYAPYLEAARVLIEHLNRRFELYGRRIVPVFIEGGDERTPEGARALGATVGAQHPFGAVTGLMEPALGTTALFGELARVGVVTVAHNLSYWWTDHVVFDGMHPYVWSVHPSSEELQANLGDMACSMLAGHPARFGDPDRQGQPRRFGIVVARGYQPSISTAILSNRLTECTGVAPVRVEAQFEPDRAAVERLKAAGVTTVFCVCVSYHAADAVRGAHNAGFHPEWIFTNSRDDIDGGPEAWVQAAIRYYGAFPPLRLISGRRYGPIQARPFFAAMVDVDPNLLQRSPNVRRTLWGLEQLYEPLLVMAAGIQSAGPNLTADTFAAGLMNTQFPNPDASRAPLWTPTAGFGPGDHSFYDDYALAWWSPTAPALDPYATEAQGSWCYLDQGARFHVGDYPGDADSRLFNPGERCR